MHSYAVLLGRQPRITIAELAATVPGWKFGGILRKEWVLFESALKLNQTFFDRLGGSIVMAERITDAPMELTDIPQILSKEIPATKKKVTFALRTLNVPGKTVKKLYHDCKVKLKDRSIPCRYVGTEKKPAVPAQLHDVGMIDSKNGCEVVILQRDEGDLWIGRTVAAQDVESYTKRDIGKPVRDRSSGLLPPKLAQIMLNFGEWLLADHKAALPKKMKYASYTVYDPFCGTGVIPLECLLRHHHVLGSDKSQKAIGDTEKNIEWMRKEMKILKKDALSDIWKHDVTKAFDAKKAPDVIVTETYLGPALEKRATQKEATTIRKEIEELEEAFLRNAATTFPGVPIVCTWPAWKQKDNWVHLEKIWDLLPEIGYMPVLPLDTDLEDGRCSIFYRRPNQFVGREIVLLMPKGK